MNAVVSDDDNALFRNNKTAITIYGYRFGFQRRAKGGSISGIGFTQRGFQWTDSETLSDNEVVEYTFNYINSFFSIPVVDFSNFVFCMGLEGSYLLSGTYKNNSISGDISDGFPTDLTDTYSTSLYDFGPTVSMLYTIKGITFRGSYYHGMNNIIKSDNSAVSLFSRNIQFDIIFNLNKKNKSKKTQKRKNRKPFGG